MSVRVPRGAYDAMKCQMKWVCFGLYFTDNSLNTGKYAWEKKRAWIAASLGHRIHVSGTAVMIVWLLPRDL